MQGRRYVGRVEVRVSGYALEQIVQVHYDQNDPAHMTIDGVDNQPPWTVLAMAVLLVFGVASMAFGLAMLVRWLVVRRLLSKDGWHTESLRQQVVGRGSRLAMLPDDSLVLLSRRGSLLVRRSHDQFRICGARRRVAITNQDGSWILLAKRPRTGRQDVRWAGRWTKALAQAGDRSETGPADPGGHQ